MYLLHFRTALVITADKNVFIKKKQIIKEHYWTSSFILF